MSSWFDEMDSGEQHDETGDAVEQAETTSTSTTRTRAVPRVRAASSLVRDEAGAVRTSVWLIPVVAVVSLVCLFSIWTLVSAGKTTAAESALAEETSVAGPALGNNADKIAVAGQCEPQDGEVTVSTGDTTLRGTIAQWEKAYYSRDMELTKYLTEGSWLREQDWETVLQEAAPEGVEWCAVMAPVKDGQVDVDVMATFSDGSSQTYQQRITGLEHEGTWLIDDIEMR